MKKHLAGSMATALTAALLLAAPAFAALGKGALAPVFTAKASLAGKDFIFSLKKAL
jgi:peroxiredoxin Q/BCP